MTLSFSARPMILSAYCVSAVQKSPGGDAALQISYIIQGLLVMSTEFLLETPTGLTRLHLEWPTAQYLCPQVAILETLDQSVP